MRGYQRECYLDTWMALAGEAIAINNGWTMSGKTCRLQDFHTHVRQLNAAEAGRRSYNHSKPRHISAYAFVKA